MKQAEYTVTKIHGEPYESHGKWWLFVDGQPEKETYNFFGAIMFNTKEEAEDVKPGYKYVA